MGCLLRAHDRVCLRLIRLLLRLALAVEEHRHRTPRRFRRWRGSVRRLYRAWLRRHGLDEVPRFSRRHRPWNRTHSTVEEQVVRLHVEQPLLGRVTYFDGRLRWYRFG